VENFERKGHGGIIEAKSEKREKKIRRLRRLHRWGHDKEGIATEAQRHKGFRGKEKLEASGESRSDESERDGT
jgi:hypothetical protein